MSAGYLDLLAPAAFRTVLKTFPVLECETVPLDEALDRFLADDLQSPEDLPATARSSMDGYAVWAADTFGATETNPTYLDLAMDLGIADVPREPLARGRLARVVTGSTLPEGADAVVMVEHTADLGAGVVEVRKSLAPGDNIQLAGEDAHAGRTALAAGTRLRPSELGFLAALGVAAVRTPRRPTAAILSTGDELVPAGATPAPGSIRDANAPALEALVRRAGASPLALGIVPDRVAAIAQALERALGQADVVFLSGGSSVGVRDLTVEALERLPGAEILVHGLAVSPGKPTILARVGGKAVWGLPGQVASAQVVMFVFGCPFLAHLAGDRAAFDRPVPGFQAVLDRNLASRPGREDYVRVRLRQPPGGPPLATPVLGKSGLVKTLVQAHGLIRIPANLEGLEAGTTVQVQPL